LRIIGVWTMAHWRVVRSGWHSGIRCRDSGRATGSAQA